MLRAARAAPAAVVAHLERSAESPYESLVVSPADKYQPSVGLERVPTPRVASMKSYQLSVISGCAGFALGALTIYSLQHFRPARPVERRAERMAESVDRPDHPKARPTALSTANPVEARIAQTEPQRPPSASKWEQLAIDKERGTVAARLRLFTDGILNKEFAKHFELAPGQLEAINQSLRATRAALDTKVREHTTSRVDG